MARPHCYACDPGNPDRMVFDGGKRIQVPERFRGLPGYLNGGVAAGLLACPALSLAQQEDRTNPAVTRIVARLLRPLALVGLSAEATGSGGAWQVTLRDGDVACASGSVEIATLERTPRAGDELPVAVPDEWRVDVAAMSGALAGEERAGWWVRDAFPPGDPTAGCFSCGPANAGGLHVFPRVVSAREVRASWLPGPGLADPGGSLAPLIIAAAIDCSSGWCIAAGDRGQFERRDQGIALGTFDVRFLRLAPAEMAGGYRVVGRWLRREGRKFFGLSGLFDSDGALYALGLGTWIIVPAPA